MLGKLVIGKSNDDEEDGQDTEAHELDGFATDGVDCGHGDPVTWDGTGTNDDQIANCGVAENMINV